MAYLYLREHSFPDAIAKVRAGLQRLALAWNAPTGDLEKGYHETMTQAWVRIVALELDDRCQGKRQTCFATNTQN